MSELKCCKLCGAFTTCQTKNECCPECQYFDEIDSICLAPDELKKAKGKAKAVIEKVEEVDPETFLFDDDDEDDEDEDSSKSDSDDDDLLIMDDWD